MNCLIIVNESPWGSGLALAAWRFAEAAVTNGLDVAAVFFREDGVYNALVGEAADSGTPDLADAWTRFARRRDARLLVCSSSSRRRLRQPPGAPFECAGLTAMLELMLGCDRVVTF